MEVSCPICHDFLYKPYLTPCGHSFCEGCWRRFSSLGPHITKNCPLCRHPLTVSAVFNRLAWELLQHHYPDRAAVVPVAAPRDYGLVYALMDLFRQELSTSYRDYVVRKLSCSVDGDIAVCACGLVASERVSRTKVNPGRMFFGCPRYRGQGTGCGFFQWGSVAH